MKTDVLARIRSMAVAAGFSVGLDESTLTELAYFIIEDDWLWAILEKNAALERKGPGPHSDPDEIMLATIHALSPGEKADLRRRVLQHREGEMPLTSLGL